MRAISLWQPWASLVSIGSKRIETRHWSTDYRGPLLIHASKRLVKGEMRALFHPNSVLWGALFPLVREYTFCLDESDLRKNSSISRIEKILPLGALVARCDLIDCVPVSSLTRADLDVPRSPYQNERLELYSWTERHLGNYEPGRYGWLLENVRRLKEPIPYKGRQNFFNVPDGLLSGVQYA